MATIDPGNGSDPDGAERLRSAESLLCAARDALRVERRRTVDEREAFEAFRSRVRGISAEATATTGAGPAAEAGTVTAAAPDPSRLRGTTGTTGPGLVAIRNAYEETVMSVPHYDEEYNDTYERSLAEEFGPELALALTREPTLHERYRSSLLAKTTEAIRRRDELVGIVESESSSVSRAREDLSPIVEEVETVSRREFEAERFGALDAYRARLNVLAGTCDEIAARRQEERIDGERSANVAGIVSDVQAYLYRELPVTYPVLAAVAAVGGRIESVRLDVERAMIHAESS
ncbi:hypothetical protein SAMN04488066_10577 [Halorubrum aquaticum]|uniref:DUF7260 domain-containing protein n=1 Tax=Halorubrum aquaticum TaxID=387340 RepID=A0A1I3ACY4_9EURY|nr:hypothetical protein [Halorubrum aquaticum]SFH47815.1 hypothetical protein SAMN04488066_10577 [Halorubrum aquaticum]